jgi:hypothetical protein
MPAGTALANRHAEGGLAEEVEGPMPPHETTYSFAPHASVHVAPEPQPGQVVPSVMQLHPEPFGYSHPIKARAAPQAPGVLSPTPGA